MCIFFTYDMKFTRQPLFRNNDIILCRRMRLRSRDYNIIHHITYSLVLLYLCSLMRTFHGYLSQDTVDLTLKLGHHHFFPFLQPMCFTFGNNNSNIRYLLTYYIQTIDVPTPIYIYILWEEEIFFKTRLNITESIPQKIRA